MAYTPVMSNPKPGSKLIRDRATLTAGLPTSSRQWMKLIASRLGSSGLSGGNAIPLFLLGRLPKGINQAALADHIGMAQPSLIRHIDQLCELGLLVREPDAQDRRSKHLMLTPAGKRMAAELEIALEAVRQEVFGHLSANDIAAALRVQEALAQAASALDPPLA